ncbi:hypothetical protein F5148DRAFT_943218 [Russula earlei]|uniref:Uncharacterized protein n=1 Tax=Russula earlei TaxID=71964 RepID=A0ACC0U9M1_9AGAM|nr:hypothetical protein F5148DRAFT_943218 [Russula earlei]
MTPTPEEKLASAPFNDVRADLILQSNDEVPVHFRVSKFLLSVASPIFADMLTIPLPASQESQEAQVVALPEDSETLDLSLRHLYPVRSPEVAELRQTRILADFAHKYQVDALEQDITRYLTDAIGRDPVGVYAIADRYGYKSIGAKAALLSLNLHFSRLRSQHVQYAPAELELLRYHAACGEAASAVASQRTWFPPWVHNIAFNTHEDMGGVSCKACETRDFISATPRIIAFAPSLSELAARRQASGRKPPPPGTRFGPQCLWNYLHRSAVVLAHHPTADAVTTEDFVLRELNCLDCPRNTRRDMLAFSRLFGTEIKKAVERVPLPETLRDC